MSLPPAPNIVPFVVDARRTCLQERFFDHFDFDSTSALLAAIRDITFNVDSIVASRDLRMRMYSGWTYWFLFLRGFITFSNDDSLDDDNEFLSYFWRYHLPRGHDPGLQNERGDYTAARNRVFARFRVMSQFARAAQHGEALPDVEPIIVVVSEPVPPHPLRVFPEGAQDPVGGARVDGWHRLFAARLFGIATLPAELWQGNSVSTRDGGRA